MKSLPDSFYVSELLRYWHASQHHGRRYLDDLLAIWETEAADERSPRRKAYMEAVDKIKVERAKRGGSR